MLQRILVTGATGFVGAYLVRQLALKLPKAQILCLARGSLPEGDGLVRYVKADLLIGTEINQIFQDFLPQVVIHLAAQSSSLARGACSEDRTWEINLSGSLAVALATAKYAPDGLFLFASTSQVYGASFFDSPVDESDQPQPINVYAKSKLAAERMLFDVLPKSCSLIIARSFNHTGPGQSDEFVLPSFASQIARIENKSVDTSTIHVGNLEIRRDFLDVRDVVDAYIALCQIRATAPSRLVVNVCSGQHRSLREILGILEKMSTAVFNIAVDSARCRKFDVPLAYARPNLLSALTGWAPKYSFDETMFDILSFARTSLLTTNATM